MNQQQILLCLDAVLTASEGFINDEELRRRLNQVQYRLDALAIEEDYSNFGEFLNEQSKAVRALADNPTVFGAE